MNKLIVLATLLILPACGTIKGCSRSSLVDELIKTVNESYVDDNAYEEFIEDVIEDTTGIEMDFTPRSEEYRTPRDF